MFSVENISSPLGEKATVLKHLTHFGMKTLFFLFFFKWTEPTESLNSRNLKLRLLKLLKKLFFLTRLACRSVTEAKIWKFKMLYFQIERRYGTKASAHCSILDYLQGGVGKSFEFRIQ